MKKLVWAILVFGCIDRTPVADICEGGTDIHKVCVYVNGAPDDAFECPPGRSVQYVRGMNQWAPGAPTNPEDGFICAENGMASDDFDQRWAEADGEPIEPMPVGGMAGAGGEAGAGEEISAGGNDGEAGPGGGAGGVPMFMGRCGHPRSECGDDADCPSGPCSRLPDVDGAPCYCIDSSIQPQYGLERCSPDFDACCDAMDCEAEGPGAACVSDVLGAKNAGLGCLPGDIFEQRECIAAQCDENTPCEAGTVCIPAGFREYVVSRCVPLECAIDSDCTERAGGICVPYSQCGNVRWACRYAGPCQADTDCDSELQCQPGDPPECVLPPPPPG